jgi:hypothetical protein
MIIDINKTKEEINNIISSAVQEILHKGLRVQDNNLGNIEDDMILMMRALQVKNKIYDFAVMLSYNELLGYYEGKIAYSLINSEESQYQELVEFRF